MIATATLLLQYVSVAAFIVTLAAAWWGVRRRPWRWVLCLPPVVWAAAGIVFYLLTFVGLLSDAAFILLGAAHRTVGAALILAMVLVMADEQ
jgi:ATP/ADP translocase